MKILSVVGTRPNFIKIGGLVDEIKKRNIGHVLVHTGQHYDDSLSKLFFDELGLPKPDINLEVGSGSHAEQVGNIIMKLEKVLLKEKPNLVIVVGDVNSTFAAAFVAKQLGIKVAHVESGLRSFDMSMPEEVNRMLTDRISDYLFTTEPSANKNLQEEGINKSRIFFVGNVMIDTLLRHRHNAGKSKILEKLNLRKGKYSVLTLHRISNVDDKNDMSKIISIIEQIAQKTKIIFPIHPRTKKSIQKNKLEKRLERIKNLQIIEPVGYLDFLCLMSNSMAVLTDSGGIQEETTVLGIPCITIRNNTERPVTATQGTNILVSTDKDKIVSAFNKLLQDKPIRGRIPRLWDGNASKRIIEVISRLRSH